MWTAIHLSAHPVWGEATFVVTAQWREDLASEPVVLERHGLVHVHPLAHPDEILTAVAAEVGRMAQEARAGRAGTAG